jgi:hypothetical protein
VTVTVTVTVRRPEKLPTDDRARSLGEQSSWDGSNVVSADCTTITRATRAGVINRARPPAALGRVVVVD